jgi:MYXO-CTERM domain-containing protein
MLVADGVGWGTRTPSNGPFVTDAGTEFYPYFNVTSTPEPGSLMLFALAGAGVLATHRRRPMK